MNGRVVVAVLVLAVVLIGGASWWYGLERREAFVARAESLGVPRLSREEAAAIVAKNDKFGLPSRLDHAPERDIEHYLRAGTRAEPLAPSPDGMALLIESRKATFQHCFKMTMPELPPGGEVRAEIVIGHYDELGVVGSVNVSGADSDAWTAFGQCATRLLRPVVFAPPAEASYREIVTLPIP